MAHHPFPWRDAFLAALRDVPVISRACEAVCIHRSTAWRARDADPEFAKDWDDAMEDGIDRAEREAFRRAVEGFEEPVIDKGRLAYVYERYVDAEGKEQYRVALGDNGQPIPLTVRKHSDALLALFLKGRRRAMYAERKEITGADGAALPASQVIIATGVPNADDFGDLA